MRPQIAARPASRLASSRLFPPFPHSSLLLPRFSAVDASPELRNKKDLIETFIAGLTPRIDVDENWRKFISGKREEELAALIREERLKDAETRALLSDAFREGQVRKTGTELTTALPPVSRFSKTGDRALLRDRVLKKLEAFVERFRCLCGEEF